MLYICVSANADLARKFVKYDIERINSINQNREGNEEEKQNLPFNVIVDDSDNESLANSVKIEVDPSNTKKILTTMTYKDITEYALKGDNVYFIVSDLKSHAYIENLCDCVLTDSREYDRTFVWIEPINVDISMASLFLDGCNYNYAKAWYTKAFSQKYAETMCARASFSIKKCEHFSYMEMKIDFHDQESNSRHF